MSIYPLVCPAGCSTTPPEVTADYCNPNVTNAQVTTLYVEALSAAAFADIEDPAEWAARLSQTGVDPDDIRTLHVIGAKPLATATKIELGNDKSTTVIKEHSLDLIIRETSDENYNFLKSTECGGNFKIAYVIGKYLFVNDDETGNIDNDLIEVNIEMGDQASNNFADPYEFALKITWKAKFHPGRIINPIA
jgi:hypothetical protein